MDSRPNFLAIIHYWLIFKIFWIIPYALLPAIAVIAYPFLSLYRRKVVMENLEIAFPDKSIREKKKIRRKFYFILSKTLVESLKAYTLTPNQLRSKLDILPSEDLKETIASGKSIIGFTGHFYSWELASLALGAKLPIQLAGIYKPLDNKELDKYVRSVRAKTGTLLIPMRETASIMEKNKSNQILYGFIADQGPMHVDKSIWVPFFGKNTPFFPGPEKLTRTFNLPAYYITGRPTSKQGKYQLEFIKMATDTENLDYGKLTEQYARLLEKDIREKPEAWLWTHKRWKRAKS